MGGWTDEQRDNPPFTGQSVLDTEPEVWYSAPMTQSTVIEQSESIANLAAALVASQLKFTAVPKTADNPFFKSKYADLAALKGAADPIINKEGLAVTQFLGFDGTSDLLTTRLIHVSGEWMQSTNRLFLNKQDSQGHGSATTYAKRYAYGAILGLVAEEDDDGNKASQPPKPASGKGKGKDALATAAETSAPGAITTAIKNALWKAANEGLGWDEEAMYGWLDKSTGRTVQTLDDLSYDEGKAAVTDLQALKKEQGK